MSGKTRVNPRDGSPETCPRCLSCLLAVSCLVCSGCIWPRDATIDYIGPKQFNVVNGVAHDKAIVRAKGITAIVVPHTASVIPHVGNPDIMVIRIKKKLAYVGHPPEIVSIDEARTESGLAYTRQSHSLVFSTYGEYSTIEGGLSITAEFEVPSHITVVKQDRLSGSDSEANRFFSDRQEPLDSFNKESLKDEISQWSKCPDQPDVRRKNGSKR